MTRGIHSCPLFAHPLTRSEINPHNDSNDKEDDNDSNDM